MKLLLAPFLKMFSASFRGSIPGTLAEMLLPEVKILSEGFVGALLLGGEGSNGGAEIIPRGSPAAR